MSGERQLPGIGLYGYWTPNSNGWNTNMDGNMRLASVVTQLTVVSQVAPLPASPADGVIYIVSATDLTHPNQIAARDNGAWVYFVPQAGWRAYAQDTGQQLIYTGSEWRINGGTEESGQSLDAAATPITLVRGRNSIANDTGGLLRCNLPASPKDGDVVRIRDAYKANNRLGGTATSAAVHNWNIYPDNGAAEFFEDGSAYLVLDVAGGELCLKFNADATRGGIWEPWAT